MSLPLDPKGELDQLALLVANRGGLEAFVQCKIDCHLTATTECELLTPTTSIHAALHHMQGACPYRAIAGVQEEELDDHYLLLQGLWVNLSGSIHDARAMYEDDEHMPLSRSLWLKKNIREGGRERQREKDRRTKAQTAALLEDYRRVLQVTLQSLNIGGPQQ